MSKEKVFGVEWIFAAGMVFFLMLLVGCQEEGLPDEEGAEVSLNVVPNNQSYASLPFVGTRWQLVGFVNSQKGKIRLAVPNAEDTYLLVFDGDGGISGRTSTNTAAGKYTVDSGSNKIVISEFTHVTKINELFDGRYYIKSMNKVFSVKLSSKGLELHYDGSYYLLFNPVVVTALLPPTTP